MKRFLTILFVAAGLSLPSLAKAQTAPKAADTTQSNKKVEAQKASPSSGSDIAIDESGAPKPKSKKRNSNAKAAPKTSGASGTNRSAEQSAPAPSPEAPGSIAIDEGGTSKPKQRPKANSGTITPPKNDSTIAAPANQVGRPE
jgi:hypothetical protein